ncbi:zinc maintenance [Hyphodiscus hymeniophilus]|uniref:Zinc maintenance n=1 Tax=Hyphodiscus hymeniophilus TaxID=353542 RepID=A0A9P6VC53_9HELO|nr:zinc maintenance [Hyphodiscus hymeniophilus]
MALAAYRHLLRSTKIAFQARAEARTNFRKLASLPPNDPAAAAAVKHAEQVAIILRQNVVQGKKLDGEEDRYSMLHPALD